MPQGPIEQKFSAALDALIADVRADRSVLAAILCGSLSHDTVWAKSDIDLVLVTIDDRKVDEAGVALYVNDVTIHALLVSRRAFRKEAEASLRNSFMHSFLAKGRLLYSHDPTITDVLATLTEVGDRDRRVQLLRAATGALWPMYKARKWFTTRGDLDYTALWILYTATPLAQVEVIAAGGLVDREVIPQALGLNPSFFQTVYVGLLNGRKTRASVQAALDAVEAYMRRRAATLFEPVFEHLREAGEARACSEIEAHFERSLGVSGVTAACEYLADEGLIGRASTAARLTKRSNVDVQELAFFYSDTAVS
jgi:predicted nucleotidyltransferase